MLLWLFVLNQLVLIPGFLSLYFLLGPLSLLICPWHRGGLALTPHLLDEPNIHGRKEDINLGEPFDYELFPRNYYLHSGIIIKGSN